VAIAVTLRDVALSDRTNSAKCSDHDRRPSDSVSIKVANYKNGLPLCTGGTKARDETGRIGEKVRIVQGAVVAIKELARTDRVG
jgi:hypothetical protein